MEDTINKTNLNTANFTLEIGKIEFKGFTLDGVKAEAHSSFTDEKVKMQCNFAMQIVEQLLAKFGDGLLEEMKAKTAEQLAYTKRRNEESAADVETEKSRKAMYDAERVEYETRTKKIEKEISQMTNLQ